MNNNDTLRRLRYSFDYTDKAMMRVFKQGGLEIDRTLLSEYLKKDDDTAFKNLPDKSLAHFLNGFIIEKRGKKDGVEMQAEKVLNNNLVLKKLKIALNLQSDDILQLLDLANFQLSSHELSAFFRKPGHKHYRECKDQILRNFLQGIILRYKENKLPASANPWQKKD